MTVQEWDEFLHKTMEEKGEVKGMKWLGNLVHTLLTNNEVRASTHATIRSARDDTIVPYT